jgi:hypothetical protein
MPTTDLREGYSILELLLQPSFIPFKEVGNAIRYPAESQLNTGLASTRHQLRLNSTSPATSEKKEPARNSAYIDKNDTIDLELHDINQAIGDAHQTLHTIFPSKGKYYPETVRNYIRRIPNSTQS